jgi:hypothetical protein
MKLLDGLKVRLDVLKVKLHMGIPEPVYHLDVEFKYRSQALYPDYIIAHRRGKELFRYKWIDGENAVHGSKLWAWHQLWKTRTLCEQAMNAARYNDGVVHELKATIS